MNLLNTIFKKSNSLPTRVLQLGEGNFLRAFVDVMIQEMNHKAGFNSSVIVVQPIENGLVDLLNSQNGMYNLYLRGLKNGKPDTSCELIESIHSGINPYIDFNAFLKTAEIPEMRFIISNTTESGISLTDLDDPNDCPPKSFPAKLTVWLFHRFQTFKGDVNKGMIFLPCELINKNGIKLQKYILEFAERFNYEEAFINWIKESNIFCNTLVDRIVPGYPRERIEEVTAELGYEDKLVVEAEPFHLWVIESQEDISDEFPADKAGLNVLFVKDLTPYRTRKVRILNGAHTTFVPVAYLCGFDTVRESLEDLTINQFLQNAIQDEIIPTLDLPVKELNQFAGEVNNRFMNPFIKHHLTSITLNSFSKFETRVLPSILEYVKRKGTVPEKLTFAMAALIEFYKGKRGEETIPLQDDQEILDFLQTSWAGYNGNPDSLFEFVFDILALKSIWKKDLNQIPGLTKAVARHLRNIESKGMRKALRNLVREGAINETKNIQAV
jgi:tagaturonate reductase